MDEFIQRQPTHRKPLEPTFRYDTIGQGYSQTRRADPTIRERIHQALVDAAIVANIGAGAGSYEPDDRHVIPIEPSDMMLSQRPDGLATAVCATATALPLGDQSVDAAMSVLSLHHWDDCETGMRELRRVARGRVVILTYDAEVSGNMWLMADYLHETAALDRKIFPTPQQVGLWLGGHFSVETVPVPRNCTDWMLGSFWAHPERVLDPVARAATSGFSRQAPHIIERVVSEVSRDLQSGAWDERHGHLRQLDSFDAGLRLVVGSATVN